ncbi:hypothetical protein KLVAMA180M_03915 [Klebsiella variicola subsp. variicola]|nr:hypothetical protein AZZ61_001226 [Klebsiella variicola]CAB5639453.1 Uncharacterised protein [Klebsiella variicola]SAS72067.1 Uncharacterised protein [Klebsiella variicola]SXF11578.1 Uncharacterised protein [Klebsiella variicola]
MHINIFMMNEMIIIKKIKQCILLIDFWWSLLRSKTGI